MTELDLIVRGTRTLHAGELRQRHRLSAYTGRTLRARVVRTILRGETISRASAGAVTLPIGRMIDIREQRAPAAA